VLDAGASTARRLGLSSGNIPKEATTATAAAVSRSDSSFDIKGTTAQPAYVIAGESSSPEWSARVDDQAPTTGVSLDTQAAWPIESSGTYRVDGSLDAQNVYRWSLALTAASLILCLWLVVRGRLR
jgi:hypothetical protein